MQSSVNGCGRRDHCQIVDLIKAMAQASPQPGTLSDRDTTASLCDHKARCDSEGTFSLGTVEASSAVRIPGGVARSAGKAWPCLVELFRGGQDRNPEYCAITKPGFVMCHYKEEITLLNIRH